MWNWNLNQPPARTFRALGVGGTACTAAPPARAPRCTWESAGPLREGAARPEGLSGGAGAEELFSAVPARGYTLPAGETGQLRVRTELDAHSGAALFLRLERESALTAVLDLRGAGGQSALRCLAELEARSLLRLVVLNRLGAEDTLVTDLAARCAEGARVELTRVFLGGGVSFDGFRAELRGAGSSLDAAAGCLLSGQDRLDMNYEAVHLGRRTKSVMKLSGVLRGRADKVFRGTIDLRHGCHGAQGEELEDMLLLDKTVRSRSLPVILCDEEDVSGNHGASIGRLDEALVFYLQSRGYTREQVCEALARAKLDAVLRRVPDEALRRELLGEEAET